MNKLNDWNKYFEPYGYKLEKKRISYWKVFSILCLCSFLIFGYLVFYTDKLEYLISPNFNNEIRVDSPVNVSNSYDINVPVENAYEHKIENNFTIFVNNLGCP